MKNLFDYATKELSQDAFLCWLFANYNCENGKVKDISIKLLSEFSQKSATDKITNLQVFKQWKYIDVLIQFECENKIHIVAIEDKTYSEEHNQLKKYNDELSEYIKDQKVKKNTEIQCHKVFYKTAVINESERNRVKTADGWKIFDIKRIYEFFSLCPNTGNDILDDYIAHIKDIYNMLYNYKAIDFNKWIGNNIILKQYSDIDINNKLTDGITMRSEIYQGKYTSAFLQKVTKNGILIELAFFFRDSKFSSWIKCWQNGKRHNDVDTAFRDIIVNNIDINKLFVIRDNGVHQNRILRTELDPKAIDSFSSFNKWIDNCIADFRTIVNALQTIKF